MRNFILLTSVLAVLCSLSHVRCDERPPSLFKAGDEWLALPEVFSNLDFMADSTPASEEDVEGQVKLRANRFWGRLYIDGWPQTIQFFRAHFGIEPPLGKKRFVFAEPRDACTELTNADILTSEHVLLVNRGACTFGTKAKNAGKTNATAVIIINNEPGLDHLPGPDAHDIQIHLAAHVPHTSHSANPTIATATAESMTIVQSLPGPPTFSSRSTDDAPGIIDVTFAAKNSVALKMAAAALSLSEVKETMGVVCWEGATDGRRLGRTVGGKVVVGWAVGCDLRVEGCAEG
ncbi:hypothetical protein B484DRAFT_414460 [Ochromonadaceae sp. CCMP2298]|nr:hypothetical protein B484DRAFT_414460 [Ochromonadaceae sp. CCMP2298]